MTIREFIRIIREGKYLVLAAMVVVVAGAMLYLDRRDDSYAATATVELMTATSPRDSGETDVVTVASSPEDVTSEIVIQTAATALGYTGDLEALADTITVEPGDEDGRFVNITATAAEGDEAVAVANAVANAYVAQLDTLRDEQVAAIEAQKVALSTQIQGVRARLVLDPADPLATAEQESIVAGYQALVTQANILNSIVSPGLVERSAVSADPVGLSSALIILIAVLAGLLAGIGLAFIRRSLDVRVRSADEARWLTGVPVLAELTGVRSAERRFRTSHQLPVSSKVALPFTESIRELRTAVQVSLSGMDHMVVVVTATDPRIARSFVAANLAASFALSGRRTIIVSGDLRRPQLDSLLPAPADWSGPDAEPRPTPVPNLSAVVLAEEGMDPADYLASARARQILDGLRASTEVVVVDAPPVLAAADATILGGYADGTVLVASVGRTARKVLTEAVARLQINNIAITGVVLTGVRSSRRMLYASTYGDAEPSGPRWPLSSRPVDEAEEDRDIGDRLGLDERRARDEQRAREAQQAADETSAREEATETASPSSASAPGKQAGKVSTVGKGRPGAGGKPGGDAVEPAGQPAQESPHSR
ncbi:polysaccharide biosynthesis tyrosine autokinase [Sanguibacter suarezii]|uniref:polysaccharide biosynthesis tyrosine autokinase n=1 Tax=Sanguibacter suarezii TaxID=60921 RepID=UPI000829DCCE|nr:polysaccharide biosynthesis tyrosine autokinase [Sanguibacter suarezii]